MAPIPVWSGNLRLSLVLVPVRMFPATSSEGTIAFRMIHEPSGDEIYSRYFEKPYYLLPDGDETDEGYTVLRDALAKTKKVAIGQLIMHGREHLVGITAHKKGLVLVILRYADKLRKPETYFDKIDAKPKPDAVQLAVELVEEHSGKFEPQKMPNEYAQAIHELVQAKVEQPAPEVEIDDSET